MLFQLLPVLAAEAVSPIDTVMTAMQTTLSDVSTKVGAALAVVVPIGLGLAAILFAIRWSKKGMTASSGTRF